MRTRIRLRPGVGTSMAALLLPSAAATAAQAQAQPIDRARTVTGERVRLDSGMRLGAAPAIARAAS